MSQRIVGRLITGTYTSQKYGQGKQRERRLTAWNGGNGSPIYTRTHTNPTISQRTAGGVITGKYTPKTRAEEHERRLTV